MLVGDQSVYTLTIGDRFWNEIWEIKIVNADFLVCTEMFVVTADTELVVVDFEDGVVGTVLDVYLYFFNAALQL